MSIFVYRYSRYNARIVFFKRVAMQCQIAVIGNGAVGKTAALGLAQAGFKVVLLCPNAATKTLSPEWDARVFALNHTAKNLLSQLKVWDAMAMDRIAPVEAMRIMDATRSAEEAQNTQLATPFPHITLDAYSAAQTEIAWIVEDQNINQALDSAIKFSPNIQIKIGKATAVTADFSQLTIDDGSTLQADLLIGADGAQSWLRNQAQIGIDYRSYGQQGVVANFACSIPHQGVAHQWFLGANGIIALLPLPNNQVSLVWSAPTTLAAELKALPIQELAARLTPFCGPVLGELTPLAPFCAQMFPLHFIAPHQIVAPRLALVGDAAHVVHPLAGHGMNLGFGDVVALLKTVQECESWQNLGDLRLLQRYARMRKEDVLLMQVATDGLERLFGSTFSPLQFLRSTGMTALNQLPFVKKQLIRQAMGF